MNILAWFDIIKNQALVSQLGSTMDWENDEIPDEEDDDCKMWLKGLCDILEDNPTQSNWGINIVYLEEIPENLACAIKDYYTTSVSDSEQISTDIRPIEPFLKKHKVEGNYTIHIDSYFADYFSFWLYVRKDEDIIVEVGHETSWENIAKLRPYNEAIFDEILNGKHMQTKSVLKFIKRYTKYINQPSVEEDFVKEYANILFYNGNKFNYKPDTYKSIEDYKNALRKYR